MDKINNVNNSKILNNISNFVIKKALPLILAGSSIISFNGCGKSSKDDFYQVIENESIEEVYNDVNTSRENVLVNEDNNKKRSGAINFDDPLVKEFFTSSVFKYSDLTSDEIEKMNKLSALIQDKKGITFTGSVGYLYTSILKPFIDYCQTDAKKELSAEDLFLYVEASQVGDLDYKAGNFDYSFTIDLCSSGNGFYLKETVSNLSTNTTLIDSVLKTSTDGKSAQAIRSDYLLFADDNKFDISMSNYYTGYPNELNDVFINCSINNDKKYDINSYTYYVLQDEMCEATHQGMELSEFCSVLDVKEILNTSKSK